MEVWVGSGFIAHFHLQFVTTILRFTVAHYSVHSHAFTSRCLVAAFIVQTAGASPFLWVSELSPCLSYSNS
jgi:hypothetical protein